MPAHRSIRSRRGRKKINGAFELQLTSMMDVLIIIVVFLLKSYATSTNTFTTVPGLTLPLSKSLDSPPDSLQVIITPESITFENEKILEFAQVAINVRLSYFNRDWFNAIQSKDATAFWSLLFSVFCLWAAIYVASAIIQYVIQSFLRIRWRASGASAAIFASARSPLLSLVPPELTRLKMSTTTSTVLSWPTMAAEPP